MVIVPRLRFDFGNMLHASKSNWRSIFAFGSLRLLTARKKTSSLCFGTSGPSVVLAAFLKKLAQTIVITLFRLKTPTTHGPSATIYPNSVCQEGRMIGALSGFLQSEAFQLETEPPQGWLLSVRDLSPPSTSGWTAWRGFVQKLSQFHLSIVLTHTYSLKKNNHLLRMVMERKHLCWGGDCTPPS